MASFRGKIIGITGAASGMGFATAKLLAERGAILSLADINGEALRLVAESLPVQEQTGGSPDLTNGQNDAYHGSALTSQKDEVSQKRHLHFAIDVRDSGHVNNWISSTIEQLGRIDGAVNMAGIIKPACSVAEMTDEDWDATLAVNARGIFNCLRAQIRGMSSGPNQGSIVSAASVFGQFGAPGNGAYSASKAAVIGLTRTAAKENDTIRINCVSPGSINTPLSQGEDPEDVKRGLQVTAQKRRAEPIEVARVIAFLLSDEASFVTGAVYNVDGGWVC